MDLLRIAKKASKKVIKGAARSVKNISADVPAQKRSPAGKPGADIPVRPGRTVREKTHTPFAEMETAQELSEEELMEQEQERLMAVRLKEEEQELEELRTIYPNYDRDHIWAFVAGQSSQAFRGNPKYMFVYINRYRKDIQAYWICSNLETIDLVKSLGFRALRRESVGAQYAINRTGVMVAEQVKFFIPEGFGDIKYVNLWHGVGFKQCERKLILGDIALGLARKYVYTGTFYRDHQLMNASCRITEEEIAQDSGVDYDMFLRTGYPRCLYQANFERIVSFDHDLKSIKGLPADTKMAVFAPTYRAELGGTFSKAIVDIEKLYDVCEKNHILLIFKVHPNMEKEVGFLNAWKMYGEKPYFWFWDNRQDFYEIMDQVDLAIVDYTSLISDMIAIGIKHYIRYVFDYDEYMETNSSHDTYLEMTTGIMCYTFDELLSAMETFEERDESKEIARLQDLLWEYSEGKDDFDRIVQAVFDFVPKKRHFDTLYSFDVFDTLFTRKVLEPRGVFYLMQEKIAGNGAFPFDLIKNFPYIRVMAESNLREYYRKSFDLRKSDAVEIHLDEIYDRLQEVYGLSDEQKEQLKEWEISCELENVVPLPEQIDRVKELLERGEHVILISDMYLPETVVKAMLEKADPVLADLPLFLSSEYGVQKTSQKLFFEVYKSFEPYYDFERWIHYGDNQNADQTQPRKFRIATRKVKRPSFNDYQKSLVETVDTYDSYLVAALQARMRMETCYYHDSFVISYVALCFVPYIDWVLRDAQRRGYETLYFVSRDGHHLKRIADAMIEARGLPFKTKYIYASRRTWRVPSFIDEIEEGFWQGHGSFTDIVSKEKLFRAMELDEETFRKFFPSIEPDEIDYLNLREMKALIRIFQTSEEYKNYLLDFAAKRRVLVNGYLKQEIDPTEKFAFVEYNGRGYTQDCMVKLWRELLQDPTVEVAYYYSRSILPNMDGSIRHDFTTQNGRQYFLEAIFANMPYKSIEDYEVVDGKIVPVIVPISYDKKLFASMERVLPEFGRRYAQLELLHPEATDRRMYDFVHEYFRENRDNPEYAERIGSLTDSVTLYGEKRQYAPPYTQDLLESFRNRELKRDSTKVTWSMTMSATRSSADILEQYKEMYQILPGEDLSAGRLLSDEEIEANREYKGKLEQLSKKADMWKRCYDQAAMESEPEHLVIIAVNEKMVKSEVLKTVWNRILEKTDFQVEECCTGMIITDEQIEQMAGLLAKASFVIMNQAVNVFAKIEFRDETKVLLLRSDPFNLYRKAANVNFSLKWRKKYIQLADTNDIDVLQIPGIEQRERFLRNFSPLSEPDTSLMGSCLTDIYFEDNREKIRGELERFFPEAKEKKVILYMPVLRKRNDCIGWANILDFEYLKTKISDEYVVVCNYNRDQIQEGFTNLGEIPGFTKNIFGNQMSTRRQMIAADVIIGDYRDTFFESCLLHKPVYSAAYDFENYMKDPAVFVDDIEEYIFAPIIRNALDLEEQLARVDSYDYGPMEAFRERTFGGCDGHSVDKVVEYICSH